MKESSNKDKANAKVRGALLLEYMDMIKDNPIGNEENVSNIIVLNKAISSVVDRIREYVDYVRRDTHKGQIQNIKRYTEEIDEMAFQIEILSRVVTEKIGEYDKVPHIFNCVKADDDEELMDAIVTYGHCVG